MEDTLINRIAIVVMAVLILFVSIVLAIRFNSVDNRLDNIEGFIIGVKETELGEKIPVTLIKAIVDQQEAIKKSEEAK